MTIRLPQCLRCFLPGHHSFLCHPLNQLSTAPSHSPLRYGARHRRSRPQAPVQVQCRDQLRHGLLPQLHSTQGVRQTSPPLDRWLLSLVGLNTLPMSFHRYTPLRIVERSGKRSIPDSRRVMLRRTTTGRDQRSPPFALLHIRLLAVLRPSLLAAVPIFQVHQVLFNRRHLIVLSR